MPRRLGTVIKAAGGVYDIDLDDGARIQATLRGRLKLERRTGESVVAGDRVEIEEHPGGENTIERLEDRRTQLVRRAPGGGRRAKVIVANVDQLVAVFAAAEPEPKPRMLDRFLVFAEANELPGVVVVNKLDLLDAPGPPPAFAVYESIGYPVVATSAKRGWGIETLRSRLCGRTSVFTGPSGVGKSSLLNTIEPGLGLRTAEVTRAMKGRHTTVNAELVPLSCGGYVADTPGLRELGLWGITPQTLPYCFPEFREHMGACRFARSCTHTHEPGCAVRDAAAAGEITPERYESYRALLGEEVNGAAFA